MKLEDLLKLPPYRKVCEAVKAMGLQHMGVGQNVTIHEDFSIDAKADIKIPNGWKAIPIKINSVEGNFEAAISDLVSLVNSPVKVTGNYDVNASDVASYQGMPMEVGGDINLAFMSRSLSLHGIHKTYKQLKVSGVFKIDKQTTNVVGLAMIPGISRVAILGNVPAQNLTFDLRHHDPHQFQEELIDAGLTHMAKL